MRGGFKYDPLCFVANNKLYVLSCWRNSGTPFEVYSPVDETWQVLPSPYKVEYIYENVDWGILSPLVAEKEHIVYFSTRDDILSFNLETREWTVASTHRSPFYQQATLVGEMAFGFLDNSGVKYVCASKPISQGKEIMQPSLAPDGDFLEALRSSRFTYISEAYCSDYIVALQDSDGKEVLCIITYGSKTNKMEYPDTTTSYIAFSFFSIPGNFFTSKNRPGIEISYADEEAEDGGVVRRYFNAKFQYTKHFIVNNSHLCSAGHIVKCFL